MFVRRSSTVLKKKKNCLISVLIWSWAELKLTSVLPSSCLLKVLGFASQSQVNYNWGIVLRCPFVILFFGSRILLCFVKTLRKNVLEKYCLFGSVESWFFFWKINFFFKFSVTCRKKCWFFPSSFQKKIFGYEKFLFFPIYLLGFQTLVGFLIYLCYSAHL